MVFFFLSLTCILKEKKIKERIKIVILCAQILFWWGVCGDQEIIQYIFLHLIFWAAISHWTLSHRFCLFLHPILLAPSTVTNTCHYTHICTFWGSKLRFSGVYKRHFTKWAFYLSNPWAHISSNLLKVS